MPAPKRRGVRKGIQIYSVKRQLIKPEADLESLFDVIKAEKQPVEQNLELAND